MTREFRMAGERAYLTMRGGSAIRSRLPLLFLAPTLLFGTYQYFYTDALTSIDANRWTMRGSVVATTGGLTAPSSDGGSLIYTYAGGIPDGTSQYEVKTTVHLTASGGTYVIYLRASADALSGPAASGTYYALEIQNPVFVGNNCTATLAGYKRVNGVVTALGSTAIVCRDNMQVHAVIRNDPQHMVWIDDAWYYWSGDGDIPAGRPGVGARDVPAGNSISRAELGPLDTTAPSTVPPQSVATTAFPNSVDIQFAGSSDGPDGVGIMGYQWLRDNGDNIYNYIALKRTTVFTDDTVSPGVTYHYYFCAEDRHGNCSGGTTFTVAVPPAGHIEARRIGVRPDGAYWGSLGEQIDTRSGNLNFTFPLVTAQGRGGSGVPFALSYNSEVWRSDPGAQWKMGRDAGYGFGWKLQAGALTPSYSYYATLHHYTFTDSSGAEYRLDVNASGIWTSREGIYLSYDENTRRLSFPDGSFWMFDSIAAGTEEDSGSMYPTLLQDSNGNQTIVRYQMGLGITWTNSSSRILEIEDVRAKQTGWTYRFSYETVNGAPHLRTIVNSYGTQEGYTFDYLTDTLLSPFTPQINYGQTALLSTIRDAAGMTHTLSYPGAAGLLGQMTFPYGGYLKWLHRPFTYANGRVQMETIWRGLAKSAGAPEVWHVLYHDDAGDASRYLHAYTVAINLDQTFDKVWWFNQDSLGLVGTFAERDWQPSLHNVTVHQLTWSTGANPYVSAVLSTIDEGTAYAKQSKIEQNLDVYGNLVWKKLYDYGNLVTPARTFNFTYLASGGYPAMNIRNRLLTATVTPAGGSAITLVSNTYDSTGLTDPTVGKNPPETLYQHDATYSTGFVARGNLTRSESPGQVRVVNYDITGNAVSANNGQSGIYLHSMSVQPADQTNYTLPGKTLPNGLATLATTQTYDTSFSPRVTTGPNTDTSTTTYDSYGRVASQTSPHGAVTTYTYDIANRAVTATTVLPSGTRTVKTTADGIGRTVKVETAIGGVIQSAADTVYDACACSPVGKVKQVSQPYTGSPTAWTTYTYDALGRTLTVSLPGGSGTTSYLYQGNLVRVTDPAGKWKEYTSDALGNLVKVTEPNPGGGTVDTLYTYNALNKLTQVQMTRGGTTQYRTFAYDAVTQRLTSATNPESGTVSHWYRPDGLPDYKIDAKNQKVKYLYDEYGRVTNVNRYVNSGDQNPDPCQSVAMVYDQSPIGWGSNPKGRVTTIATGNVGACQYLFTERYDYSVAGSVVTKRLRVDTQSLGRDLDAYFEYDGEGRQTMYSAPQIAGQWEKAYYYGRDPMGRATTLTEYDYSVYPIRKLDKVTGVQYGPASQLTQMSYWGYTETRQYNVGLQLTRLTATGGGAGMDLEYRYSAAANNGRVTQIKDFVSGEEVNFTYDALNRLIEAYTSADQTVPQWSQVYSYDGFGNLYGKNPNPLRPCPQPPALCQTSVPQINLTVDSNTNRITGPGTFVYDNNGNLTQTPGQGLITYDVENRVRSAGSETWMYGPDNRRLFKTNSRELYFYGPDGKKLAVYVVNDNSVLFQSAYVWFEGRLLRQWTGMSTGVTILQDRLGSVRANSNGERIDYFPYGEERTATSNNREKFGTYYRDSATGFDYADQRYYAGQWGRFLTADISGANESLTESGSWNQYAYVLGDPANFNDPDGLATCGDRPAYVHGAYVGSLRDLMQRDEDLPILAATIFTESAMRIDTAGIDEMSAIGAVIINRWQIVNGNYWLYAPASGRRVSQPVNVIPAWGTPGGSIKSIVQNPAQFSTWRRDGDGAYSLSSGAQARLDFSLDSGQDSNLCIAMFQAATIALYYIDHKVDRQLYTINGYVATSFNSFSSPRPSHPWEQRIASFGTANVFYGVSPDNVSPLLTPIPLRPRGVPRVRNSGRDR